MSSAKEYFRALEEWQPPKAVWCDETPDSRDRTWPDEEYERVLKGLFVPKRERDRDCHVTQRHTFGDMFIVISQTALRPGEVCRIKKADIDLSEDAVNATKFRVHFLDKSTEITEETSKTEEKAAAKKAP